MLDFLLELFVGHVVLCNMPSRISCNTNLRCVSSGYIKNESIGEAYNKLDASISAILPKLSSKYRRTGNDERYIKFYGNGLMNEKVEKEFNYYKQEKYFKMLKKLQTIEGILQEEELLPDVYEFLKDENFIEEVRSFRIMNGGLMDEWVNDCWKD